MAFAVFGEAANQLHLPRIKDKRGSLAIDLVPQGDTATKNAIRRSQGVQSLAKGDVVRGMYAPLSVFEDHERPSTFLVKDSDDDQGSDSVPSDED